MKVSFVIPAYNEAGTLRDCLNSVMREIRTANIESEVIVADNGSTDGTHSIISSFDSVRRIDEARKGANLARQAGLQVATGEYIASIDADTILPEGWLQQALGEFSSRPHMVALSGPFLYYDISPIARSLVYLFYLGGYGMHFLHQFVFRVGAMIQGGNLFVRRDALMAAGGYDTSFAFYGDDTALARALSKKGMVRFSFRFTIYTSGRRLRHEGLIRSGWVYALNHFWVMYTGKPHTLKHTDIRPHLQ